MCNLPYMQQYTAAGPICVSPSGMVWTATGEIPLADYLLTIQPGTPDPNNPAQGTILTSALENAGGILSGIGDLFSSIKGNKQGDTVIYQQQAPPVVPSSKTPIWVWILIPVVGLLGLASLVLVKRRK